MEKFTLLPNGTLVKQSGKQPPEKATEGTLVKQSSKQPFEKPTEKRQMIKKPNVKKNHRESKGRPPGVRVMWEKFTG